MKRDQPVQARQANLFAIAGFVVAMCGIVLFTVFLGPLGAILGLVGWRRTQHGMGQKAIAIAAMIIGAIEFVFSILIIVLHYS